MSNPILLLHGALGSSSQFGLLKKLLEKKGSTVYSMDFSGHSGEAFSTSGFGIEVFAEDVLQYLNKVKLETVNIFGYSMGGYVALWLASQYPQRVNYITTLGTKFDWSPESAAREIKKMDPEKIIEKIPAFARLLEHRHAPNDWKKLMGETSRMMVGLGKKPLLTENIFSTIIHKANLLLGDQDDMADRNYSEQVANQLGNGKFHLLENTPHPIENVNIEMLVDFILN